MKNTVCARVAFCVWAFAVDAGAATTVTLVSPQAAVQDVAIRGGSFAATNFEGDLLVTRLSSDPNYVRRTLLDFDTESTIPPGSTISSATLSMTVHSGGSSATRLVAVRSVTTAFAAGQATWDVAAASTPWLHPGGDLGSEYARAAVSNAAGASAVFTVTALVQAAVGGSGSRHSRMALVDVGSLTDARAGYRDYYPSEAVDPATRPTLTVTFGPPGNSIVPAFSRVFIIMMENKEYSQIVGSASAPYVNNLVAQYGLATNYTGVGHPSLPNYMALTGGETVFTSDCVGCTTAARHVVDQIVDSGRHWKAYLESMPAACSTTDTALYVQKHNPWVHYTDVVNDPTRCRNHVVPYTQFPADLSAGALPEFVWITPNMCHDTHDCSVPTGDTWLSSVVPQILASPAFNNAVLFLLWDEGTTTAGGGGRVAALVVSPLTPPGTQSAAPLNHYSVLRTIEDAWGLPRLGQAAGAAAMAGFFRP